MIHILGCDSIPAMQCLDDVRDALTFDMDVYLGAFLALPLGVSLSGKAVYNTEYLHEQAPIVRAGYLETLKDAIVVDYSRSNLSYLAQHGINAFYMPYGFHRGLERILPLPKDIDVLFIGTTHHPRRKALLERLSQRCNLVIADGVYGAELDRLAARARVHLNLHHADGQPLEVVRLNYLMANNCNVVSEPGSDGELNSGYAPWLRFAKYEELIDACLLAIEEPVSSVGIIKQMPQNCATANAWAKEMLCQQ